MNIFDYDQAQYIYRDTPRPTFSGSTGETNPKTVVKITIGSKESTADFDPITGRFSWMVDEDLPDGIYNIAIITIDAAGNAGTPLIRTLVIDTTPPEAPELINLKDDVGSKTGSFDPGELTDDAQPTLTGVAQPGTIVYLRDATGKDIGSAKTDTVTGKWVLEPNQPLPQGENTLTLVAIEEFGKNANKEPNYREGKPSEPFIINVGSADFVTIDDALDNAGNWSGVLTSGALTDDTTPTLRGHANEGEAVTLYYRKVGQADWSSASAALSGDSWSWTPSAQFEAGDYEFQAKTKSSSSDVFTLDIFTSGTGDQQTIIKEVLDNFGAKTGLLSSGDFTDDMTPTFNGRAEANSRVIVEYSLNGTSYSTTVLAGTNGDWSWTPVNDLSAGDWTFSVKSEGAASWNSSFELHIYPSPSVATTITEVYDDVGVAGPVSNNGMTDDNTPRLSGRTEANAIVDIYDGKLKLGSARANANGDWSFDTASLSDGLHNFWAIQKGYSLPSSDWAINIDTSGLGPDNPTITGLLEPDKNGEYHLIVNGSLVTSGNVQVQGKGHAGATINIYDGTLLIGSTQVNMEGKWTFNHSTSYSFGSHSITAKEVKDENGESSPSNKADFTLVGDGVSGESIYLLTSINNDLFTGTRTFNPGYLFKGHGGGWLTLVSGTLGSKNNSFSKDEPGNLKTLGEEGTLVFKTDPTTDFYMSVGAITTGYASLTYYSINNKYLGTSEFDYDPLPTENGARNSAFRAPPGELIGQVYLKYKDKGGIAILNVTYGYDGRALSEGSEYFTATPARPIAIAGTWESSGFSTLEGYGTRKNGGLEISEKAAYTFSVGRVADIQFSLSTPYKIKVTFYDALGNALHSEYSNGNINYTAPAGSLISKINIDSKDYPGIVLDNVTWGSKNGEIDYGYDSNSVAGTLHDDNVQNLNGLVESSAIVNMQDGEATTTVFTLEDILSNGEVGLFTSENTKQLMVQGDNSDVVQLKDILPEGEHIEQWTQQKGTITVAGVEYSVYSHGDNAQLLVQSDLKVEMS
jgi:hypothetical protein